MKTKRRLRPIEIVMFIVPLCALAFASWRLLKKPHNFVEPPRYIITDLGALGRGGFFTDLNDRGELTGVWKANGNGSWAQVFTGRKAKLLFLRLGHADLVSTTMGLFSAHTYAIKKSPFYLERRQVQEASYLDDQFRD